MYTSRLLVAVVFSASLAAQQPSQPSAPASALTIYNENFAVARTTIDLDLHPGINEVSTNQVTTQLEPDSVVLRDPSAAAQAKPSFRIVEQNYDAAVVTQDWLLKKYEGKIIQFALGNTVGPDGRVVSGNTIAGKIIRAPQPPSPYGNQYGVYQQNQPLIEVNGEMQFQLPGTPLFPATTDGLLLKPTLRWQIDSAKAQKLTAELAYITGGMNWEATYNVVTGGSNGAGAASAPDEKADVVGWVTITNRTGADFPQARIKLMAGDVAKIQSREFDRIELAAKAYSPESVAVNGQVTQKPFDDYHLYDLNRTVSLTTARPSRCSFLRPPASRSLAATSTTAATRTDNPSRTTAATSSSSRTTASAPETPRSKSSRSSKTAKPITWASRCRPAAFASIAATLTARSNSSVRAPSITRPLKIPSRSSAAAPST